MEGWALGKGEELYHRTQKDKEYCIHKYSPEVLVLMGMRFAMLSCVTVNNCFCLALPYIAP